MIFLLSFSFYSVVVVGPVSNFTHHRGHCPSAPPPSLSSSLRYWAVCGEQGKGKDKTPEEQEAEKRKEGVRLKRKAEEERRVGLFTACRAGFAEEVRVAKTKTNTASAPLN